MLGPLTQLRLRGNICPCLLNTDESVARNSDSVLSELFKSIRWHQSKNKHNSSNDDEQESDDGSSERARNGGAMGFISSMLPTVSAAASSIIPNQYNIVTASCQLVDASVLLSGSREGIVLEIVTTSKKAIDSRKRIPLRKIGEVCPTGPTMLGNRSSSNPSNIISIYAKSNLSDSSGHGKELARLELTSLQNQNNDPIPMTGEDVVEHFNNILEWDKARRKMENDYDEEDDDSMTEDQTNLDENLKKNGSNGKKGLLRGKAEKVAHFAKRELEMQQLKREREQRKAKYLKDTGGLKYTALAMANRS